MAFRFKSALAAGAVALVSAFAPATQAETFKVTFSAAHGSQLPWIGMIENFYMPEVDKRLKEAGSKHNIVWNKAFSGTLAKVGGELDAVSNGVAEMGYVYTIFEPAKLPLLAVCFMATTTACCMPTRPPTARRPQRAAGWIFLAPTTASLPRMRPLTHAAATTSSAARFVQSTRSISLRKTGRRSTKVMPSDCSACRKPHRPPTLLAPCS